MTGLPRHLPAMARAAEAETLSMGQTTLQLLLDAGSTGDALSAHRVHLRDGAVGANPHRHTRVSELFFVLDGSLDVLAGESVLAATAGDLVVVPPGHAHAFAATARCSADVLVMITPGIERFDFFRALSRAMQPGADPVGRSQVMASQPDFDTYPSESSEWSRR
jgi:mannose-6-phosphate isomerase-like protein (cupin superfamily)